MSENPTNATDERHETIRKSLIVANIWLAVGGGLYIYNDLTSESQKKVADDVHKVLPTTSGGSIPAPTFRSPDLELPVLPPTPPVRKEPVQLTMDEIGKKVLKSLLIIEFSDKYNVRAGLCTGFVYAPDSFVTAKHCPGILTYENSKDPVFKFPNVWAIHEYPQDSKKISAFNSYHGPSSYSYFKGGDAWNAVPDIVKVDLQTAVFSDRDPLPVSKVHPQFGDKFYTVHFLKDPDKSKPLGQWDWYVQEGTYIRDRISNSIGSDEYTTNYYMKMPGMRGGNSGSAVVNNKGEAIGVLSASEIDSDGAMVSPFAF